MSEREAEVTGKIILNTIFWDRLITTISFFLCTLAEEAKLHQHIKNLEVSFEFFC